MKHFLFAHVFSWNILIVAKKVTIFDHFVFKSEQLDQGECSIALTQFFFSKSPASESLS
jgi:hypothetical protein